MHFLCVSTETIRITSLLRITLLSSGFLVTDYQICHVMSGLFPLENVSP